jgi:hypothetical protein
MLVGGPLHLKDLSENLGPLYFFAVPDSWPYVRVAPGPSPRPIQQPSSLPWHSPRIDAVPTTCSDPLVAKLAVAKFVATFI